MSGADNCDITKNAEAPSGAEKYDETSGCWQTHRYHQLYGNEDEHVGETSSEDLGHLELTVTRTLAQPDIATKLEFVRKVRHQNFVNVQSVFRDSNASSVIVTFEFMPVVVIELCAQAYSHLTQLRLAAIMGQVVQGLDFLESAGIQHSRFDETQVLADLAGNVKIRGQEWCAWGSILPNLNGLVSFTSRVMFPWRFSADVINDEDKWSREPEAMEFVKAVNQASSVRELARQPLLQRFWRNGHVKELIALACWESHMKRASRGLE